MLMLLCLFVPIVWVVGKGVARVLSRAFFLRREVANPRDLQRPRAAHREVLRPSVRLWWDLDSRFFEAALWGLCRICTVSDRRHVSAVSLFSAQTIVKASVILYDDMSPTSCQGHVGVPMSLLHPWNRYITNEESYYVRSTASREKSLHMAIKASSRNQSLAT